MGTGKLLGKRNKLCGNDLRWTSILSRGSRNTPNCFMLQKPGIRSGSYEPVGSNASFFKSEDNSHICTALYKHESMRLPETLISTLHWCNVN